MVTVERRSLDHLQEDQQKKIQTGKLAQVGVVALEGTLGDTKRMLKGGLRRQ